MRYFIIALSLLMAPLEAQNLTQFQNGQVADAVAINDNFESIVDAIEDLQQGGRLLRERVTLECWSVLRAISI